MATLVREKLVNADEFKYAFRKHPAGVAIITTDSGCGPVAMTVSSLFSVSIDPPTLVFSASSMSSSTPSILNAETVVVHMLDSDQMDLAKLGATSGAERFGDDIEWGRLDTGEPYYPQVGSWLRGRISQRVDAGGSTLIVVEALEASPECISGASSDALPLVYHNRTWHSIGEHSVVG